MGQEDNGHEQDCRGGVERCGGELPSFVASSSSFCPQQKNKSPTPISQGCHVAFLTTPPSPVTPCMFPGPDPSLAVHQKALCATSDRSPLGASIAGRTPSPATSLHPSTPSCGAHLTSSLVLTGPTCPSPTAGRTCPSLSCWRQPRQSNCTAA